MEAQWTNAVWATDVERTWKELADEAPKLPQAPTAVVVDTSHDAARVVGAVLREQADVCIVDRHRMTDAVREALSAAGFGLLGESEGDPAKYQAGRISILTSGTTGTPKLVPHTIDSLSTMNSGANVAARRWLCPYSPGSYAWFQCVMLSLAVPEQDLVCVDPTRADWADVAAAHRVSAISSTPTFWKRGMLTQDELALKALPLAQITLGGEVVEQSLLNRLREWYPQARISTIYAATEVGACIVVHDGQAGFPTSWLGAVREGKPQIRNNEGLLEVRSPHARRDVGEDWIATGDSLRVDGERTYIEGRKSERYINVGGAKVDAFAVQTVLSSHPEVVWARVFGRKAPIAGEIVAAEVVVRDREQLVERDLRSWCKERLEDYACPRRITFRDELEVAATGKAVRS